MDINVSQMESQDIIKNGTNLAYNLYECVIAGDYFSFNLHCMERENIEKLIITIMMIISFNN